MANRYRNQHDEGYRSYQDEDRGYGRQPSQFDDRSQQQFGEDGNYHSYDNQSKRQHQQRPEQSYGDQMNHGNSRRDHNPLDDYEREGQYYARQSGRHGQFRADSYGGESMTGPSIITGGGSFFPQGDFSKNDKRYGRGSNTYGRPERNHERGFLDRAGDEVASWFGDEEAERRREMDHRGRGPKNYTRSNERMLEDACDRLTHDRGVDASDIQVTVDNNEVTLDGKVNTRWEKRRAEDCVYDVSGVKHVQNNLRLHETEMRSGTSNLETSPKS